MDDHKIQELSDAVDTTETATGKHIVALCKDYQHCENSHLKQMLLGLINRCLSAYAFETGLLGLSDDFFKLMGTDFAKELDAS